MPTEPIYKRVVAFFDGQNLFHAVKEAFAYTYPNYDPIKLSLNICKIRHWNLNSVCFYTGVPDIQDNKNWHIFWTNKLAIMKTRNVRVYHRSLRYNYKEYKCPNDETITIRVAREKGIDVRLAIDAVRMARRNEYDVCLIFSQDQDLSEVADEIRGISIEQNRWIKVASAFPLSGSLKNRRGINNTEWIPFDKALYDTCIDPLDYRPRS